MTSVLPTHRIGSKFTYLLIVYKYTSPFWVSHNFLLFSSEMHFPHLPWIVYISPTFRKDILKDKYLLCRWILKEIIFESSFRSNGILEIRLK